MKTYTEEEVARNLSMMRKAETSHHSRNLLKWEKGDDKNLEATVGGLTFTILTGSDTLAIAFGGYEILYECKSTREAKLIAEALCHAAENK